MKTLANPRDHREIVERLRALAPSSPRQWGTLTPGEMLCHLADASDCALGRREAQSVDSWLRRTLLKQFALRAPLRWPRGYATRPEFDPRVGGTRPEAFEADRARAIHSIDEIAALTAPVPGAKHPVFGVMSAAEWQRWAHLHADHHLRQFSL